MAEYIEREAALEAIQNLYPGVPFTKRLMQKWHEEKRNFMQCENAIERLPAADVAPVRHGRWIDTCGDSWTCSACGTESYVDEDWHKTDERSYQMNYCHYCGAKMDGEA